MQTKSGNIAHVGTVWVVTFKATGRDDWKLEFYARSDGDDALRSWWNDDMTVGKLLQVYEGKYKATKK